MTPQRLPLTHEARLREVDELIDMGLTPRAACERAGVKHATWTRRQERKAG